ncbi:MAG: glycosyltransferase family 2 protein [Candidatus Margulisiibacteriota bacterium]
MLKTSVVIVNYNGERFLNACLNSICDSQTPSGFEVIVVDNASQDGSVALLKTWQQDAKSHYPQIPVTLILNADNTGFSYANNQGIARAKGQFVFLLNNDTVTQPDCLAKLEQYFENNPESGGLGPCLLNADGSVQGQGSAVSHFLYKAEKPKQVSFISGAAFFTTKAILESIGGLDENYFFYNEDLDLCRTIRVKVGKTLVYLPEAKLTHFGGLSTATRKPASVIEGYRGGLYFVRKQFGVVVFGLYRMVLWLEVGPRLLWACIKGLWDAGTRALIPAYLTVLGITLSGNIRFNRMDYKTPEVVT